MALGLVVLLGACSSEQASGPPQSPPEVTVAQPTVRAITDWDEYTGRFEAVDEVEVRARVSGYLSSVHFEDGQIVEEGRLLYVIDQRPFETAVAMAEAELEQATVRLNLAANDLGRAERLFESRAISEEELDARQQARAVSAAEVQAAQARVRQARLDLEFTEVKAPISGRIGDNAVTRGSLISGGSAGATHLTTIVSLDPIHVYFTADERSYLNYARLAQRGERPSSRVEPNPVKLMIADEAGFEHEGVMDFVDNRIDEATGTMLGRAIFENPDKVLVPGLFARVRLIGRGPYDTLLLPDQAIGTDQAQKFVYLIDQDSVARRQVVEIGRRTDDGMRIITSGLQNDDRVVVNGLQRVRVGQPVTPVSEASSQDPM
ncbi:MAG: efflux RND transporter periplasmic adaptor subunit [Wenzhouxiangellaceae bacterium]